VTFFEASNNLLLETAVCHRQMHEGKARKKPKGAHFLRSRLSTHEQTLKQGVPDNIIFAFS
jgi:hypothetical protein